MESNIYIVEVLPHIRLLAVLLIILSTSIPASTIQPIGISSNYIVIRLLLSDNTPLPGAKLKIMSGIFTTWSENISDSEGYVYLRRGPETINKLSIEVYYEPYGLIYEEEGFSEEELPSEIILPYKLFKFKATIVDEYLKPVNTTYKLLYGDGRKPILENTSFNGLIEINGRGDNGLIIIGIDENSKINLNDYVIVFDIDDKGYTYRIGEINGRENVSIDIREPVVKITRTRYQVNEKLNLVYIYVDVSYSDGINTNKTTIHTKITYTAKGLNGSKHVEKTMSLYNCSYTGIFNKTCTYIYRGFLSSFQFKNSSTTVKIEATAKDPTGKTSSVWKNLVLVLHGKNRTGKNSSNIIGGENGWKRSVLPNISQTTVITSGFKPPVKKEEKISYLYYAAPLISISVLLYEVKRYLRRRGSVYPSSS